MKKRILSLLLVAAMATAALVGCGQTEKPANTETSKTTSESTATKESETKATEEAKEVAYEDLPTINLLFAYGYANEGDDNEIWREVATRIGAKVHIIAADEDKYNAMIASGEGYDILVVKRQIVNDVVDGGSLLALDDLIAEKGQNIQKNIPEKLEYSRKIASDETGALYVLPAECNHTGLTVPSATGQRGLIRWDLYKAMGYPEINSMDDYLKVIADMQAQYPTTADGSKVYGMAIPSDQLLFTVLFPASHWVGQVADQTTTRAYDYDVNYINTFGEGGSFWTGIDYYHKAYLMGLLDPDSFIMTEADMKAKATDGKLLEITAIYQADTMADGQGFMSLPRSWGGHDQSENATASKLSAPKRWFGINKNSDKIDLCMNYLDFVYSEEGLNLIMNGFEGEHYTVENGVRVMTDEAKELYKDATKWAEAGLGNAEICTFVGLDKKALGSDGNAMLLGLDDDNFVSTLNDVQKDFCEYYGVDYPSQIYFEYAKEYDIPDIGTIDHSITPFLPTPTDEIKQLEAAVLAEAESVVASLVMASEKDYEAKIADAKKRFEKAGLSKINEYYETNWQSAYDMAAEFQK